MSELPTKPHPWHHDFHDLHLIVIGTISMSRHSLIVRSGRDARQWSIVSAKLAEGLLERMEPQLRAEVERLLKGGGIMPRGTGPIAPIRALTGSPVEPEDHVAHALLYLVGLLAEEFGGQQFFEKAQRICARLVRQTLASRENLKRLRFKAVSSFP